MPWSLSGSWGLAAGVDMCRHRLAAGRYRQEGRLVEPIAELLHLPGGYGRPTRMLGWAVVRAELERALHYWVATTGPDGRPHVVPVDGLWLDDVWYYGGSDRTVHHRNVRARPDVVMHLPDAANAVIVEGEVRPANPSAELAQRLADASQAKYGYSPGAGAYSGALALFPRRVRAWRSFPEDATRFRFV